MSREHDDHGNTPAAWTAVAIIIAGFTVGGIAFMFANVPMVFVGAVIALLGVVVGKVMQMMGMGAVPAADAEVPESSTP